MDTASPRVILQGALPQRPWASFQPSAQKFQDHRGNLAIPSPSAWVGFQVLRGIRVSGSSPVALAANSSATSAGVSGISGKALSPLERTLSNVSKAKSDAIKRRESSIKELSKPSEGNKGKRHLPGRNNFNRPAEVPPRRVTVPGWKLQCSRDMALDLAGTSDLVDQYLREPVQVVHVAFPDTSRLAKLSPEVWQARLRPVTFFNVTATPICSIRAWYDAGKLRISSESLELQFINAPEELTRVSLRLMLDGYLGPLALGPTASSGGTGPQVPSGEANARLAIPRSTVGGRVDLALEIGDLPLALQLIPAPAASQVGSAILAAILEAMKGALQRGLQRDFALWAQRQRQALAA